MHRNQQYIFRFYIRSVFLVLRKCNLKKCAHRKYIPDFRGGKSELQRVFLTNIGWNKNFSLKESN